MSIPDFERAEYLEPRAVEGEVVGRPQRNSRAAFPLALVFGAAAAVVGSIGYGLVASFGFMISIVAIGIAWLVAKAMMTASGGVGDRSYQIAAAMLTYFAVTFGELVPLLWKAIHVHGAPMSLLLSPVVLRYALLGPFLELRGGLNGILGIVILAIGIRAAWKLAAGSPGFGSSVRGPRMSPFGP